MSSGAAVPVLFGFVDAGDRYWGRDTRYRATFQLIDAGWSEWSLPMRSTFSEKGLQLVLTVTNASPGQTVRFERSLAPLLGETDWTNQILGLGSVPGNPTQFVDVATPPCQFVRLTSGVTYDGVNSGFSFWINNGDNARYVMTLPSVPSPIGLWAVTDLCDAIRLGFATNDNVGTRRRIEGLKFQNVPGTFYLRCYCGLENTYPANGLFRVFPYLGDRDLPNGQIHYATWGNDGERANILNAQLGFGPVPLTTPKVSAATGQNGFWPVRLA